MASKSAARRRETSALFALWSSFASRPRRTGSRPAGTEAVGTRAVRAAADATVETLERRQFLSVTPLIDEFLAANNTGIVDEDGERGDWLELNNPTPADVNLNGYFLTDDAATPTKWKLPATVLPSGGFLTVFADGKDRATVGKTLHTNFSLASGGGYLALVGPNGTSVLSSYNYPQQLADTSYGVAVTQDVNHLIGPKATDRATVPTDGSLGTSWTAYDFDDTSWTAGTTGAGYETGVPTSTTPGFLVRMVDTNGGNDGQINTAAEATSLLNGTTPAGAFSIYSDTQANRGSVNFGGLGSFGGDLPFPNMALPTDNSSNANREQFALRATAGVNIPAGTWTIDVGSDDGFSLTIPGVTFARRTNENTTGSPNPSPSDTLVYGGNRSLGHTFATFTVPAGGLQTTLNLDYFDFNSTDGVELSVASGDQTAFAAGTFSILADGTQGWVVRQPTTPGFLVTMIDTQGGTDGYIDNIADATAILNGTAPAGAFTIASTNTASRPVINMGSSGAYGNDGLLPNGTGGPQGDENVPGREQYVIRAVANVTIPAGTWTIDVHSDDGFRLRIPGVTFTNRQNEEFSGAQSPSPADTLVFGAQRGPSPTFATFTVPTGGLSTTLQLDEYETGGGDSIELAVAGGSQSSFNASTFQLLGNGVLGWSVIDPTTASAPNYAGLIGTNLRPAMQNVNATAYVRVPFSTTGPDDFDTVRLKMKYDDGFVAYVNGVEVARRNAPAAATWNSAATASRDDASAVVYESISVPPSVLRAGTNVLAIQGLNDSAGGDDFLVYPELEGVRTTVGAEGYQTPTPGAANGPVSNPEILGKVKFSTERGFFNAPFQLALTTPSAGATIRYTTNGSAPTASTGSVYTGPLTISATTTLRAAAFKPGAVTTDVGTETYVFTADVIRQSPTGAAPAGWPSSWGSNTVDYGMDPDIVNNPTYAGTIQNDLKTIPSLSIVMNLNDLFNPQTGIYANPSGDERAWERPASIEVVNPDGTPGYQANAGIRIRGGYSRSTGNPKHGFRLFFRSEYGDSKFDYPIFGPTGAKSSQGFDLRTDNNYSWSFEGDSRYNPLRDTFSRDTQLAFGQPGERGDYYHLYINGQYWGLYNTDERPEANYAATYYGGTAEDYDVVKVDPDLGYNVEATDGNLDAWTETWTLAKQDLSVAANYQRLLGNNPDGTRNPAYKVLVDRDNLIDYMLTIYYTGNLDAPISDFLGNTSPNNFFAFRNRNGDAGWRFIAHDSEHTLRTDDVNRDRTGPFSAGDSGASKANPQWLFQRLAANADFKLLIADHVQKAFFNGGPLTPTAVKARLQARIDKLDRSIVGESARWGDSKVSTPYTRQTWLTEVSKLMGTGSFAGTGWADRRTAIVLQQLRNKGWYTSVTGPLFSQRGGVVSTGFTLSITNPNGVGTIYYTTDGTDPRLPNGTLSPAAAVYTGPVPITKATRVIARVLNGTVWSAAENALFTFDTGSLRVSELMYNPGTKTGDAFAAQEYEYVELLNTGAAALDLTGINFDKGITFAFPAGTTLAPGARTLVVKNQAAFEARYGTGKPIAGVYTGSLDNSGEEVRLSGGAGQVLLDFTYSDAWYPVTDGDGYSLVVVDPAAATAAFSQRSNWRPSNALDGGPGVDDPGVAPGSVVINEVLAFTDTPNGDYIELYNPTAAAADVSGWYLSDDKTQLRKYKIPAGTSIPAGGYLVVTQSQFDNPSDPGALTPFGISELGETVYLSNNDGAGNAGGYRDSAKFSASAKEVSFGRYPRVDGSVAFTALQTPTKGGANSAPRVGPVVVNEVMYNPSAVGGKAEYVELRNLTSQAVDLYDLDHPANTWTLTQGTLTYAFPQGTSIPANGYLIVAAVDPATFRSQYAVPPAVQVFGPYPATAGNGLDNGGGRVVLARPREPQLDATVPYVEVDAVEYDDAAPWPLSPDGNGPSLGRVTGPAFGDDAADWAAEVANGSPGRANFDTAAPVADIVDVTPDPRANPLDAIVLTFDEPVKGVDAADLRLTRDGVNVPLSGSGTPVVTSSDGQTYTVSGLAPYTTAGGSYVVTLAAAGSGIADYGGNAMAVDAADAFVVGATNPAPTLVSMTVDDGTAQRSQVKKLTLVFSQPVTLGGTALTLARWNSGGSGANDGTAQSDASVALAAPTSPDGGLTWVFTFAPGGPYTEAGGSLKDGIYTATVNAAAVSGTGGTLGGSPAPVTFHRKFGDQDGSKAVNNADYVRFRAAFGSAAGGETYNAVYDFDGNGSINNSDYLQFRSRFGTAFTYPS